VVPQLYYLDISPLNCRYFRQVVGDFSNLFVSNAIAGTATGQEFVTILAALVAPLSLGTVKIASSDASVPPLIDPGWLTDPVDQRIAVEAFKRTREFFSAKAMQPILDGPEYLPGPSVTSDAQILEWIQNNLMTGMLLLSQNFQMCLEQIKFL
jgi:choline dehydrogenase-like flavoprotein